MPRILLTALVIALLLPATTHAAPQLEAGAGRADITPPTGFYTMGYVRSDAVARGVHTRLLARAIVLRSGTRKVALVATDLAMTPGGLLADVADRLQDRGFTERDLIVSASHTHGGPAGFSNAGGDNFIAPTMGTPTRFSFSADRRLYAFLVRRIAESIARADDDLGPAKAGWGRSLLKEVTDNRSVEAHLANHGLEIEQGHGRAQQDPEGVSHTIDETVDVLRVDRIRDGRDVPLGAWMNFANHGTAVPYTFDVYSADHHGPASRRFEAAVRRAGRVPDELEVVGAYGNANAGDMAAALRGRGPAFAQRTGEREATAMLVAWRRAGRELSAEPVVDARWTRACFCARKVDGVAVAEDPIVGLPFLTGSDENRGPLYDVDGIEHEGDRLPAPVGPHGRKIQAIRPPVGDFPEAMPLTVLRIGHGALATVPGEMTAEMGRRTRAAVQAELAPAGVKLTALAGYANEYIHYFTTPEEYEQQHYEGGSTLYGTVSGELVRSDLAGLGRALAKGDPAPEPFAYDPRLGLRPDDTPYPTGAESATVVAQPATTARLTRATMRWKGGTRGYDRPLDGAFVSIERRVGDGWDPVTDDLGLEIVWRVDDAGEYTAAWQVPRSARAGEHRFVITANRYRLASAPFAVEPSTALRVVELPAGRVQLAYPEVDAATDLNPLPELASGGVVRGTGPDGRPVADRRRRGTTFRLPPGTVIPAGGARDRWGNTNAEPAGPLSAG